MEEQNQIPPRTGVPKPVLEYRRPAQERARVTASDIVAAIVAIVLATGLLILAGMFIAGTCYVASGGDIWATIAGFLGFALLLSGAVGAIGNAVFIIRGYNRLPQGFHDASRWKDNLAAIYSALIGAALVTVFLFLVPALLTFKGVADVMKALLVIAITLLAAGKCLVFAWRRIGTGNWIRRMRRESIIK
jgi:hypothetical protein